MFLRKSNFTTFWEEVGEIVCMLAAFPGLKLVIKPHTRGGRRHQLMNWADIIIDLATSVVFEAVKARKPVLVADYLHAGRSALAHFMPETELTCRDDVYKRIDGFLSNGFDSFYVGEHRQRFIDEMINVGGPDVLARYVALLEAQARPDQGRDQSTHRV